MTNKHVTIKELGDALGDAILDRLEDDGRCRFNCRTNREAFFAGYTYKNWGKLSAQEAWHEYKQVNRRREGVKTTHDNSRTNEVY